VIPGDLSRTHNDMEPAAPLLLLSDLHYDLAQFDWVEREAPSYGCVMVAGDFLDMFAKVHSREQRAEIAARLGRIAARGTWLVACSGNHDEWRSLGDESPAAWLHELKVGERFVGDGRSRFIEWGPAKLVVTTLPWSVSDQGRTKLLREGRALKKQHRCPWFLLHHDPPKLSQTAFRATGGSGSSMLSDILRVWGPDFALCGHVHDAPFEGGAWCEKMFDTWCFNPGRPEGDSWAATPSHIVVDLAAREASWRAGLGVSKTVQIAG